MVLLTFLGRDCEDDLRIVENQHGVRKLVVQKPQTKRKVSYDEKGGNNQIFTYKKSEVKGLMGSSWTFPMTITKASISEKPYIKVINEVYAYVFGVFPSGIEFADFAVKADSINFYV